MKLTFLGSGDAFGSGGRFYTCFLLETNEQKILIDCGASAVISMKKAGLNPAEIDVILITHLHGDHFGGIPFFLIDAKHGSKRTKPLTIAGPPGLEARTKIVANGLYAQSMDKTFNFDLQFVEMPESTRTKGSGWMVTPEVMDHPSGAPSYGLRLETEKKIIAYSGDTQWTDNLITLAAGADLFICECYKYDTQLPFHLDYQTLIAKRDLLTCKQMILTHMSDEMLAKTNEVEIECAFDGKVVEV